jgi:hypothetical protein
MGRCAALPVARARRPSMRTALGALATALPPNSIWPRLDAGKRTRRKERKHFSLSFPCRIIERTKLPCPVDRQARNLKVRVLRARKKSGRKKGCGSGDCPAAAAAATQKSSIARRREFLREFDEESSIAQIFSFNVLRIHLMSSPASSTCFVSRRS